MKFENSKLTLKQGHGKEGLVQWRSPSNIALIKYWGKHGNQLPNNPSISFTLSNAYSETSIQYVESTSGELELSFQFEGEQNEAFEQRIHQFLKTLDKVFPFLSQLRLDIKSSNSFPHSTGIASSASAMSALALCLCDIEHELFNSLPASQDFLMKASYVARLGSGSACRSVTPELGLWGKHKKIKDSSDEYAIPMGHAVNPAFRSYRDTILIVSAEEKSVSSTAGHALMDGHKFEQVRYQQANDNLLAILEAMEARNFARFGQIVEEEALTLHSMMMTSQDSYILLHPNTLRVIEAVREYRRQTAQPLYFTLDAGPNVHLLYPDEIASSVGAFIKDELVQYCENGRFIEDQVGDGPQKLIQ